MIGLFGGMTTPVVEYKAAALAESLALKAVRRSSIRRLMLSTSVLSNRGPALPEHAALMTATNRKATKGPLRMVSQYPNAVSRVSHRAGPEPATPYGHVRRCAADPWKTR